MQTVEFIDLTISFIPPVECTKAQAEEWIAFQLGIEQSMSAKNPLVDSDLKDCISFRDEKFLEYETRFAEKN